MLRNLSAIASWLLPPLAVVALPTEAPGLTCLAMIYLYLGGLCLAVGFIIAFFATRKKPQAAAALILTVGLSLLAWRHGFTFGTRLHLLVNEHRYSETVRKLASARSSEEQERICGERCMVIGDQPIVVFHYCHCFLNWPDLVYDASGTLDGPRAELQKISPYLHGTRRISKFWYIGYFGD